MANPCGPDIPVRAAGDPGHLADHLKLHCDYNTHNADLTAHAGTYEATPASFSTLPSSYYVWHRGGATIFPEDTMEAFRGAINLGAPAIKLDVYDLLDGALGIMHDATVDRTTTSSGTNSTFTSMEWRTLVVDAGSWFAPGWGNLQAPMLEDVLEEFGGKVVLLIESKRTQATDSLIAAIKRRGLQNSVMFVTQDSTLSDCAKAKVAGIRCLYLYNGPSPGTQTPASVIAAGATELGIGYSYSDADIATIAGFAAPHPPHSFTIARRFHRDRFQTLGINIWHADNPYYTARSTPLTTSDRFAKGLPIHGFISNIDAGVIPYTGSPKRAYFNTASAQGAFAAVGWASPITSLTYTIFATITYDILSSDATRWAAVETCALDDRTFNGNAITTGYNCILRQNGTMQIFKQVPGAVTNGVTATGTSTQVGTTGSGTAISAGQSVPVTVTVTPTTIIFTRTDTSVSCSATDNTYRGGYFHIGMSGGGAPALEASFSAVSVV